MQLKKTVEAVQALGRKAIKIKANVANADEVAAMVEEAHKEFGHIDILVNNAGITRDGLLMRMKMKILMLLSISTLKVYIW